MLSKRGLALGAAVVLSALVSGASPAAQPQTVPIVPSLEPQATEALWRQLVRHPRRARQQADCRPLRGVFYAATDWLRLATKLAAAASPCADYLISIPPIVGDKTSLRHGQAERIRALGPRFHALAEFHWTTWGRWVSANGRTWYDAGVEFRRRMAAAGFDVAAGDTWAVNELPSTVRSGAGATRTNARELVRGLYEGDGGPRARGVVFVVGLGQSSTNVAVYQTNLQNWLADQSFWLDMSAYVSDWSQEVYGDVRRYAVPGAAIQTRRDYLNEYLQHVLAVAGAGPPTIEPARGYLQGGAFSPLANAAWQYESGYGWTMVPVEQMQAFVSAQVYALRSFGAASGRGQDHWGFAWQPRNAGGMPSGEFTTQTGALLDRLAAAVRDSAVTGDPADPGSGACGPPGQNLHCGGELAGAQFTELWKAFRAWSELVLAFATPPQALTAGRPSAPLALTLIDRTGVPRPAVSPIVAMLGSSSAQGQFSLSASGPWTGTLAVTIPVGSTTSGPFYYLDTRAAWPQLRATAQGATTATQLEAVEAGPAAKVALEPTSAVLRPYASQRFSASALDAFGNPVSSVPVRWSVQPAALGAVRPAAGEATTLTAGGRGGFGRLAATVDGEAGTLSGLARLRVEPGIVRVSAIRYATSRRLLRVTATLLEVRGAPARNVQAAVVVRRAGRWVFSGRKRTGAAGRVTYLVPLERGCYRTAVTGVAAPGYRWNGKTPANRFCR